MSNRDEGIRALIPGQRSPDEIREDQNTKRYVETIVKQRAKVTPEVDPLGETLARTTPSLNLGVKPEVSKETKGFKSQREYTNHLINSPSKTQHVKALQEGKRILEDKKLIKFALEESPEPIVKNPVMNKAIRNKWANEWMTGGGREKGGRSLDQEIKLGKDTWLKNQKTINQLKSLKEHHHPKTEANKGNYIPWYERMAQEEAESLNNIKRSTWEQGGRVRPEPKYVTAQDVKNVYEKE